MASRGGQTRLYVILGSHACRSAMLMLEHKDVPYELVTLPSGMHPAALRVAGFSGSGRRREIDAGTHRTIALADFLGTVPALCLNGERVQSNRDIARFLDRVAPDPPLLPDDPAASARVAQAARWGDETLQMMARRTVLAATTVGRVEHDGSRGRLGPLLFRSAPARLLASRLFARNFGAYARDEEELLKSSREMLDHVDALVQEGVLGGEQLFEADFVIAPSVALLSYHTALSREIGERPLAGMLDRLLPAP